MAQVTPRTHSHFSDEDRDMRVEDYLNDKLQIAADLDNLESLLENVRERQNLLTEQVYSPNISFSDSISCLWHSSFKRPK